ncbi:hypothetical protein ABTZ57_39645 [Streptomyces sp. NPDC094048]|uniref:hypothetical protein n=1 Tax=Streptomyces sp. NPDC094048 TaxID=3155207 RepID=UPI00331A0CAA
MPVRPLSGFSSPSASRRGSLLRRLVVTLLLPLLTLAGSALLTPGTALAARASAPSAGVVHSTVSDPASPCTSGDPVVCSIRGMTPEQWAQAREIRIRYHELLDSMERVEDRMRAEGRSDEEIARVLVAMRNEAKDITRAGMSPEAVKALEARNMVKYGNPLGPTADQQFAKYGSWAAVIDAATRSNAAVDQELGLEPRH